MKIVLLGPPGSGKGTQSKLISNYLNIPHISTGEIFRKAYQEKTELGIFAKKVIDTGKLVPDDITIKLIEERIKQKDCANGFILDGFPRNLIQGEKLNKLTNIDLALFFDLHFDEALKRVLNRRICPKCGATYNKLTHAHEKCKVCGVKLIKRDEDNKETLAKRFESFNKDTFPLIDFYKKHRVLKTINVDNTIEDIFKNIKKVIGEFND